MRQILTTIAALLIATAVLLTGNGLQGTLLSVRANLEGFPLPVIGMLMSTYFVGFILGCRYTPKLVRNVGHIRAFTALASVASASALAHALAVEPVTWMALRAVTGFCFAGLAMIIESWINERAANENRGTVLSIYRMVDLAATTGGNLLLTLADPMGFTLFALTSILISVSLVPVALTTAMAPEPIAQARLNIRKLMRVSPLGVAGVFSVGIGNSVFWAVGAVFVLRLGYSIDVAASFMSTVIIGGALSQVPVGYLSDRFDRRIMIIIFAVLGGASAIFIALKAEVSVTWLLAGAAGYGFFGMTIFGLSIAHSNDHVEPDEYLETNGGLLLLFGVGSVLGPVLGPTLMAVYAPPALFYYVAGVNALLLIYGLYRMTRRPPVPEGDRDDYIVAPRTTPAIFELDPRVPDDEDCGDDDKFWRASGPDDEQDDFGPDRSDNDDG